MWCCQAVVDRKVGLVATTGHPAPASEHAWNCRQQEKKPTKNLYLEASETCSRVNEKEFPQC